MLAIEKQHLSDLDDDVTLASIREHLAFLKGQISHGDARIKAEIEADEKLAHKTVLLKSIPGIGATTAAILIAALVGVAPMNRDNGQWRGQAHITGERLSVRCSLYMVTLPAIRFNPTIRAFNQHLRAEGKLPKSPSPPP
jgi:transposase